MSKGFLRSVEITIGGDLDPALAAADFAQRVRADLAATIAAGEAPPNFTRYVDGRKGADEFSVKPGGTIFYEFSQAAEIAVFALAFLRARSPTGTASKAGGAPFRDSFWASVNGKFIAPGDLQPKSIPADAELIFGNLKPYNRKVDVQLIGRKSLRFNVPEGLYDDAARAVNRQFGNFVQARRVYNIAFPGKYTIKETQARSGARAHNVKRWAGTPVESPALVINPR